MKGLAIAAKVLFAFVVTLALGMLLPFWFQSSCGWYSC